MGFRFYKFCQNGLITVLSASFSMFYVCSIAGSIAWWFGLLIALSVTLVAFVPPLGLFYPLIFAAYIIAALIASLSHSLLFSLVFLAVFVLHSIRFVAMFAFIKKNPEKSLEYDMAIRYGM